MPQHVILFYHYYDISDAPAMRDALDALCQGLQLRGRILVAAGEGLNGTLASSHRPAVEAFVRAMCRHKNGPGVDHESSNDDDKHGDDENHHNHHDEINHNHHHDDEIEIDKITSALHRFWDTILPCSGILGRMKPEDDFKWSTVAADDPVFPDLYIKVTPELIGTGGLFLQIPLSAVGQDYLSPAEWHRELLAHHQQNAANAAGHDDTIWIDCRNDKEYQLGHFDAAVNPRTVTFSQFPRWVQQQPADFWHNKQVRMYCTGGIRCEKASAYIRQVQPTVQNVKHLKGGIHQYLAIVPPDESLWKGKNFVFDGRSYQDNDNHDHNTDNGPDDNHNHNNVVGQCIVCETPYDQSMDCVCTVCRENVLVCPDCRQPQREYHCFQHAAWKTCYFTNLDRFADPAELQRQLDELQAHHKDIQVGKAHKQRRKTLRKQMVAVEKRMDELQQQLQSPQESHPAQSTMCRSCGDTHCEGRCWGFMGLKRKERLEQQQNKEAASTIMPRVLLQNASTKRHKQQQQKSKQQQQSKPSHPPGDFWQSTTQLRVPPPTLRVLSCSIKRKWRGRTVGDLVQEQWNLSDAYLDALLRDGLLLVNATNDNNNSQVVKSRHHRLDAATRTLARICEWREAPIYLPTPHLSVQRVVLPEAVVQAYKLRDPTVWVGNKPSSVPVHPAGPFQLNSWTCMLQGQLEKMTKDESTNNDEPGTTTVHPLHRIDRVTSGLLLCATDPAHARWFHASQQDGTTRKLYLARVHGHLSPATTSIPSTVTSDWSNNNSSTSSMLQIEAPIFTADPARGLRVIDWKQGKAATSRFRLLEYQAATDTSVILCAPQTGRNHQLRVHLQAIGHAIVGDVLYGGAALASHPQLADVRAALDRAAAVKPSSAAHITDAQAQAARALSSYDTNFTPAQLLQGGHEIQLHAYRYQVSIPTQADNQHHILDVSVELPPWATTAGPLEWLG